MAKEEKSELVRISARSPTGEDRDYSLPQSLRVITSLRLTLRWNNRRTIEATEDGLNFILKQSFQSSARCVLRKVNNKTFSPAALASLISGGALRLK